MKQKELIYTFINIFTVAIFFLCHTQYGWASICVRYKQISSVDGSTYVVAKAFILDLWAEIKTINKLFWAYTVRPLYIMGLLKVAKILTPSHQERSLPSKEIDVYNSPYLV